MDIGLVEYVNWSCVVVLVLLHLSSYGCCWHRSFQYIPLFKVWWNKKKKIFFAPRFVHITSHWVARHMNVLCNAGQLKYSDQTNRGFSLSFFLCPSLFPFLLPSHSFSHFHSNHSELSTNERKLENVYRHDILSKAKKNRKLYKKPSNKTTINNWTETVLFLVIADITKYRAN